mgnify:FL=1|jgi:hypothetical protein|tara:strand:+ start:436 stop:645 length:210 start_codon:yes stop_codon:yes gene_type:complete
MAQVTVVSYHNGGMPREMEGNTPAELATQLDLSLQGVQIHVESSEANATHTLADGNLVSFQKSKVASGK